MRPVSLRPEPEPETLLDPEPEPTEVDTEADPSFDPGAFSLSPKEAEPAKGKDSSEWEEL